MKRDRLWVQIFISIVFFRDSCALTGKPNDLRNLYVFLLLISIHEILIQGVSPRVDDVLRRRVLDMHRSHMVSLDPVRSFEVDTIVFYWANFFNFFAGAALF